MNKICKEMGLVSNVDVDEFQFNLNSRIEEYQNKGYNVEYSFSTCVDALNRVWYSCLLTGYIIIH